MKKIYLLLAALVGFFAGSPALAQSSSAYEIDETSPLITDASQLSSPYSQNDLGDKDGDGLDAMIDDNAGTYWHSYWGGGSVAPGTHYFQVEMPEGDFDLIAFKFTRRNVSNDHIISWGVYGTNDFDAEKTDCEQLALIATPHNANNETITSPAFPTNGYTYLRFYCEDNVPYNGTARGYFHVAEFQLYPAVKLGEIEAAAKELEEICERYTAYTAEDYFPTGTKPGDFSEEAVDAFLKAYEDAIDAVDNSDDVDEMKALGEALVAAYDAIAATRVPITLTQGYYRIRTAMRYYQNDPIDEENPEVTDKVYYTKHMRANLNADGTTYTARWGTSDDPDSDASALWKVTPLDSGRYDIMNVGYEARFNDVARSTDVTMSVDAKPEMVISALLTDDNDETIVNINVYPQDANGGALFLHQGGHGADANNEGTGKGAALVGWYSTFDLPTRTAKASEWIFEPVSDEEAQKVIENFSGIKDREAMLVAYDSIMAHAKTNLDLAIDLEHHTLINDASQLSSPCSDSAEGQHIEYLIDGNADTFWHTDWHNAYDGDLHYLQVQLAEPVENDIYLKLVRRPNANNNPTEWVVRGFTTADAADDAEGEELATLTTPFGAQGETITTPLFSIKDYTVLRFYVTAVNSAFQKFWHMAEFQLGYDASNPNAQALTMGDVVPNLQAVVEKYDTLTHDQITVAIYNELKAAYDAFMAKFVDPTILRNALAEVKGTDDMVVTSTTEQPGYWKSNADAVEFAKVYAEAEAYDKAGAYTKEKSQGYIDQLNALVAKIKDPNATYPVKVGKWYRVRFAPRSLYEEKGWDLASGNAQYNSTIGRNTSDELYSKVVAAAINEVAKADRIDGTEGTVDYNTVVEVETSKLGVGSQMYFIADDILKDQDMALFRFISVGDSAYIMQNKATGLFVKAGGATGAAKLSVHPTLFTTSALGYGTNAIAAKKFDGTSQNYLHGQVSQNILVTWGPNFVPAADTRSALYIEEVEDVVADYDGTEFNMPLQYGAVHAFCFPVEITPVQGEGYEIWTVNGVEGNKLSLAKIEGSIAAGRPFIAVAGDREDFMKDEPAEMYAMKKGYDFVTEPLTNRVLKGTFDGLTVPAGAIIASDNTLAVAKAATALGANTAYLSTEEGFDREADVEVVWDENAEDGIQTALANVSRAGAVYTIDGRLVSRKANLNDLSRFGKGVYILNGTKVIVK